MVNLLQLIRYMTLFTLYYPKLLLTVVSYIGIVNFENEFFEYLFTRLFEEDDIEHHDTTDYRFYTLSIKSDAILISWADMFLYLILFWVLYALVFIISLWTKPKPQIARLSWTKRKFWQMINYVHAERALFISICIRVALEIYLDCLFGSVFNTFNMTDHNSTDNTSTLVAFSCFMLMIAFAVLILFIVIFAKKSYTTESLKTSRIKSLYLDMSNGNQYALYSHVVFIALRIFLVFLTMALYEMGASQISLYFLAIILVLVFKIKVRPYDGVIRNIQDLIGHFLLLSLCIVYFSFINQDFELSSDGTGKTLGLVWVTIISTIIF